MRKLKTLRISGLTAIIISAAMAIVGCAGLLRETTNYDGPRTTETAPDITDKPTEPDNSEINKLPPKLPVEGDLMAEIVPMAWDGDLKSVDPELAAVVQKYAANLLTKSLNNDSNVMVSPTSVFLALAMTLNGADGQTREEMITTLAKTGLTAEEINDFSRVWINNLTAAGTEKTEISIANSIWLRQGFDVDQDFLQTNADYYGAGARELDFSDMNSKDIINNWVDINTNGLIEEIVSEIDPLVVMYLINTVYFKADWQVPFESHSTFERTFRGTDGDIEHDFMNRSGDVKYFEADGGDGVVLPYDDGSFAYIAVLPKEGEDPVAWLEKQTAEGLFAELYQKALAADTINGQLSLPKYEAEYEDKLNNELIDMGMTTAFDDATADFSLINQGRRKDLFIGEVVHKTFIAVDEKGTEAAAATSVAIRTTAIMTEKELIFDRPFFYTIMDMRNGLPLFTGVLDQPVS